MKAIFQSHINGLRALAVIGVVFFHFQLFGFNSGFVGVDIFFVISGYLMTRILFGEEFKNTVAYFTDFWLARIRRIVPALVILTLVCTCVFTTLLLSPDYRKFLRSAVTANLFLSNYFFLAQSSYFDNAADNKPLLHTWSLSVEWQFYLIYPIIIYTLRNRGFTAKVGLLVGLAIGSYIYCGIQTSNDSTKAYFELLTRVWEFLAGGIVFLISTNHAFMAKLNCSFSKALGLVSLIAIPVSFIAIDKGAFPGWIAAIPVAAAGLLILTGQTGMTNRILSSYPLQWIGNLSYSLYLWHWPIYVYLAMAIAVDRPVNSIEKTVGLFASLVIAFISYKCVEQPIRTKATYWSSKKLIAIWIATLLIFISALAIALKPNVESYRLPSYLANAEKALIDKNPRQAECLLDASQAAERNYEPLLCRIGVNQASQFDAILWGDSFADAIQPMVEDVLTTNNLSGVVSTLPGCLPLNNNAYTDEAMRHQFNHCEKGLNLKTLEFIANTPSLKYIIMTANWSRYDKDVLYRDFVQHVCILKKMQRIPVLIGPVPSPNYDTPRQWGNAELKHRKFIPEMTFPRSSVTEVEKTFVTVVEKIQSTCGLTPYIVPSNSYCEGDDCYAVRNGEALYVDSVHLSRTGSFLMRNELEALLLKQKKN